MKLYLDDVRKTPPGFDLRAYTAQEAIDLINSGIVTHISFDHDLGDESLVGNGRMVAEFIEQGAAYGTLKPITWEIHSSNPPGRKNIMAAMISAERFWRSGITLM